MIVYLSGFQPSHFYIPGKEVGVKHYLYSFHTYKGKSLRERWHQDYKLFVDSGGYSARVKGVKIDVREYADFLLENAPYITIAANLDTNDQEETLRNQQYLMDRVTTVKILPIYHYSDYINPKYKNLLDKFIEKYDYIGVGGVAGVGVEKKILDTFLNYVFSKTRDKIRVHGFGITDRKINMKFPFYSVDSTSWQQGMRFGGTIAPDGKKLRYTNKKQVIAANVPMKYLKGNYRERLYYDIPYWINYEKEMTDLWKARGITWKD